MPETKERITISIDAEMLHRIEEVVEARGESRSKVIDRMLSNSIDTEEHFVRCMENPALRTVAQIITAKPALIKAVATALGDEIVSGRADDLMELIQVQAKRGKTRAAAKKVAKKRRKGGGAALA